tara:strand:+ start:10565 stop:13753 length:3189 start_codon:yes stop_codon:yes gene_type:complete
MAKVLKTVAIVAAAVALVATGVGAFAAAGTALASTAATVATVASVVATAATIGANLLYKPPPARGSVNQIIVEREAPRPYMIGRTYSGGVLRHDTGYGATLKKVPNPYRGMVIVYSGVGPIQEIEQLQLDYSYDGFTSGAHPGYYNGYLWATTQLGSNPQAAVLTPNFAGMPDWGASHKLSGHAAALWNLKFDKDAKRFASGLPRMGLLGKGVKVYDPRADSTYPGGSGACRSDDESTFVYRDNPAVHALTYALGRVANGKRVFGIGLGIAALVVSDFVAFANVCDANGWTCGGVIHEPGDKWANLKDILAAGGAQPVWKGAKLGLTWSAPHVSVGTIDEDDLADDDTEITASQSYSARLNGIVPKYRSEEHQWEYVSAEKVQVATYVTEDGEEKTQERQWNMVQDADQVAQLAAYALVDARELSPIEIVCKPHMRGFHAGDCMTVNLPQLGLVDQDCLILQRSIDPATLKVHFTLRTETADKHDYALGRTGTPPPTPALVGAGDRDEIAAAIAGYDDLASVPLGSNLVINSEFTNGLTGWSAGWDGTVGLPVTRGRDLTDWWGTKHVAWAGVVGTPAAGTVFDAYYAMGPGSTELDRCQKWAVPVIPGEKLYYSALVAGHRCNVYANLQYKDINGNYITEVASASAPLAGADTLNFANGDPTKATRVGAFHTVPANCFFAFLNVRASCPGGQADPYIFFSDGFIAKVEPAQTAIPPYMPGPGDRRADVTGENTANNTANVGAKTAAQLLSDVSAAALEASNAAIDASDAQIRIQNIVSDSVLDKSEKPDIQQRWSAIDNEAAGIDGQAAAYGITTERTNYINRRIDLAAYLGSLSPAWYDASTDTPINRTTFNAMFTDFYAARQAVLNKIAEIAGQRAQWANVSGSGKAADNATVGAPSGTNVGGTPATTVESGANAANNGVNSDGTIKDNKVGTSSAQDDAFTDSLSGSNGSSVTGDAGFTYQTAVTFNVTMGFAGDLILIGSMGVTFSTGHSWGYRLVVNDGADQIVQSGTGNTDHFVPMQGRRAVSAGTYACKILFAGTTGASLNAGAAQLTVLRRYK